MKKTVIFVLALALVLPLFCGCGGKSVEESTSAAVERILTCTLDEVNTYYGMREFMGDVTVAENGTPQFESSEGMVEVAGEMEDYIAKRFGAYMTEKCLEQMTSDRLFVQVYMLADANGSGIEPKDLTLTRREGEHEVWDFTAELTATKDGSSVSPVSGTVVMKQDGGEWKADNISMGVHDLPLGK